MNKEEKLKKDIDDAKQKLFSTKMITTPDAGDVFASAAVMRYINAVELAVESHATAKQEDIKTALQFLKGKKVRPHNQKDVAGMMEEYIQLKSLK